MTKGSTNYTWTRGRLLGSVAGVSDYTYDRNGRRIKKVVKNGNLYEYHNYYYDGDRLIAEKRGNKYLYFFYDESGVCGMRYNGENYEFVRNIFGDVLGIYNEDILVAAYAYDAWGNITQSVVLNDIGNINPFRYRGYYYDTESGLYYLMSRYYDPEIGQFISMDTPDYLKPDTIGGVDLYAYCGNNPVMYVDVQGNKKVCILSSNYHKKTCKVGIEKKYDFINLNNANMVFQKIDGGPYVDPDAQGWGENGEFTTFQQVMAVLATISAGVGLVGVILGLAVPVLMPVGAGMFGVGFALSILFLVLGGLGGAT